MFQSKGVGASGRDERVLVIWVLGNPGMDGVGVGVYGSVIEEYLPDLGRDVI